MIITGAVLHTGVFHLDYNQKSVRSDHERFFKAVVSKIPGTYREVKIAIGNGTACRETETLVAALIKQHVFDPFAAEYWYYRNVSLTKRAIMCAHLFFIR